jgi:alpha-ketoglutarate-dependent taurine dioxygenase
MKVQGERRLKKVEFGRRKAINLSEQESVRVGQLEDGQAMPVLIEPAAEGVDLVAWARAGRGLIEEKLLAHGAILFRGFNLRTAAELDALITASCDEVAHYQEAATPRTYVGGNIYTSTDFPPAQRIFLHNENSHCPNWPLRLFFFCLTPAERGGETPVADSRRVMQALDPKVRARFLEKKIMYVRNFGDGLGLPWQAVFNQKEKAEVEAYFRRHRIEWEWRGEERLRIRYVREAAAVHPRTGEKVWFNHVPLFHISRVEPEARAALLAQFGEEGLPYNACYGDGSAIEDSVLDEICATYLKEMRLFRWQTGDVLMLDNMLAAHGREPFEGRQRKILVGMAEPAGFGALDA